PAITRQRWPLMASAGVLVLVLLALGVLLSSRKGADGGPSAASPADQSPAAPTVGTPSVSNGVSAEPPVTPVASPAEPPPGAREDADPRARPPSSARSSRGVETPATNRSSPETATD